MKTQAFANIQLSETERQQFRHDQMAFEQRLSQLNDRIQKPEYGFFGPKSITWKVYREPGLLMGGVSALLLQIAHPAIAEGVKLFSNFHEEYLHRAQRTFLAMSGFYFGHPDLALKTARHLFKMHSLIRGTYPKIINGQKQKLPFCAKDPELLCWVLATLVDTSIQAFQMMHQTLSNSEQEQFFEESKIIALLMGIPPGHYPSTYPAFKAYYQQQLQSATLLVGPTAQNLAQLILHPPYSNSYLLKITGAALLPPHLAQAYQLQWTTREQKHFHYFKGSVRALFKCLPPLLRHAPPYHQAQYRIRKAQGKHTFHPGRWYDWLAKSMGFPFCIQPMK